MSALMDAEVPGFSVFSRDEGIIRHFLQRGNECGLWQIPDKIHAAPPILDPCGLMLDLTPEAAGPTGTPR
jgi:hypothetical protein